MEQWQKWIIQAKKKKITIANFISISWVTKKKIKIPTYTNMSKTKAQSWWKIKKILKQVDEGDGVQIVIIYKPEQIKKTN